MAMKTQQQVQREEQQRIKSLVLNYDLRDEEQEGKDAFPVSILASTNAKKTQGLDKSIAQSGKLDKAGATRSRQRARKLQLSDVDW